MKTRAFQNAVAALAVTSLVWSASTVPAQNLPGAVAAQPAGGVSAPQLAYGVPQILQLAQAKVGDDTIIAYIKNSGNSYGLTADQIIYLRQQGLSDAVITAMLNQPRPGVMAAAAPVATPATPAPQPVASTAYAAADVSTATAAPTVSYIQSVPATTCYYQPYYYYPSYCWYPPVSLSFGWVWGGGHGGSCYYGGWHGGGYCGGGWHGGGWHR